MQRLDYVIPPFLSVAWVSEAARRHWRPRFKRINQVLIDTTLSAVAEGLWEVRRIRVPGAAVMALPEAAARLGLSLERRVVGDPEDKGPVFHDVTIGSRTPTGPSDGEAPRGIAACCHQRVGEAREQGWRESVWESALATPEHRLDDDTIAVPGGHAFPLFFHRLLVNPFSHPLCRVDCPETARQLARHLAWMRESGVVEEAAVIEEMAHWPVEWSALHGIAELRTPLFKIAYETDATGSRHRVRVDGSGWPEHGAHGLDFPYRPRARRLVTDSRAFQRGLWHGSQSGAGEG